MSDRARPDAAGTVGQARLPATRRTTSTLRRAGRACWSTASSTRPTSRSTRPARLRPVAATPTPAATVTGATRSSSGPASERRHDDAGRPGAGDERRRWRRGPCGRRGGRPRRAPRTCPCRCRTPSPPPAACRRGGPRPWRSRIGAHGAADEARPLAPLAVAVAQAVPAEVVPGDEPGVEAGHARRRPGPAARRRRRPCRRRRGGRRGARLGGGPEPFDGDGPAHGVGGDADLGRRGDERPLVDHVDVAGRRPGTARTARWPGAGRGSPRPGRAVRRHPRRSRLRAGAPVGGRVAPDPHVRPVRDLARSAVRRVQVPRRRQLVRADATSHGRGCGRVRRRRGSRGRCPGT